MRRSGFVDGGSIDLTERGIAAQHNATAVSIRYARRKHAGVATPRNRGVIYGTRRLDRFFFDDDRIAERDCLIQLTEKAVAKDADCVGGLRTPKWHDVPA